LIFSINEKNKKKFGRRQMILPPYKNNFFYAELSHNIKFNSYIYKELMHLYFSIKKHFIGVNHYVFQLFFETFINNKTVMDWQAWHALCCEM